MEIFGVKEITQKDNHTFAINWTDDKLLYYRLSDLQKNCPCANCVDEITGKRLQNEALLKDDVRAVNVISVGRYALRVQFTSGCSQGIFGFDTLRMCGKEIA